MAAARNLARNGPSSSRVRSRLALVAEPSTALGLHAALAAALDAIPTAALVLDPAGAVVAANRAGLLREAEARRELGRVRPVGESAGDWTVTKIAADGTADQWFAVARDEAPKGASAASAAAASWDLTPRQAEVLALALDGLPTRVIAARLGASTRTIEVHLGAIYAKAGVASRSELIARALRGA